jgi:hypothetical protein
MLGTATAFAEPMDECINITGAFVKIGAIAMQHGWEW